MDAPLPDFSWGSTQNIAIVANTWFKFSEKVLISA